MERVLLLRSPETGSRPCTSDCRKEQEALRDELRAYYDKLLTPEVEDDLRKGEGVGQVSKDVVEADGVRRLGRRRLAEGVGRPRLTPIEQFVFFDESMRSGAPVPMLTINSVAPTIMRYGSEEQKQFYVPKILEGRDPLRDRVHRARRGHRPRVAEDAAPCATATSTSSTGRRCSRASRAAPTTSGSRCAPTRK